jgi:hypothetical protein
MCCIHLHGCVLKKASNNQAERVSILWKIASETGQSEPIGARREVNEWGPEKGSVLYTGKGR